MMRVTGGPQRLSVMAVVATVVVFAMVSGCDSAGAGGGSDPATYTVSYDANGADSGTAPDAQTKIEGVDLTLSTNSGTLARSGYAFVGWDTTADGSGTDYTEGATYTTDADLKLYAKWTANQYTVSFDRQDGTGGSTSVTATYGQPMPSATAPSKAAVVFGGYYTGLSGSGTQYYTAGMESARDWDLPADTELIAYWIYVGGPGPAGGIVFYDKGSYSDGWRYLEAWTADEDGTYQWKTSNTETTGTSPDIGTGYANTYAAMTGTEHPPAEVVRNATHGGYDDWFLPSKDELNEMYAQRGDINGFASADYWSSSEHVASTAWGQDFDNGDQYDASKNYTSRVRAARAF